MFFDFSSEMEYQHQVQEAQNALLAARHNRQKTQTFFDENFKGMGKTSEVSVVVKFSYTDFDDYFRSQRKLAITAPLPYPEPNPKSRIYQ